MTDKRNPFETLRENPFEDETDRFIAAAEKALGIETEADRQRKLAEHRSAYIQKENR